MIKKWMIALMLIVVIFATPYTLVEAKGPTVTQLQKKIAELTKQVKTLTASLTQRNKENVTLKKDKATLQAQLKNKNETANRLQREITSLKESVEEKSDSIEDKDRLIEQNEKRIKDLELLRTAEVVYTNKDLNSGTDVKWYKFKTQQAVLYMTPTAFDKFGYLVTISDQVLGDMKTYFESKSLTEEVSAYIFFGDEVSKPELGAYYLSNQNRVIINGQNFHPYNQFNEDIIGVYVHEFAHAFEDVAIKLFENVNDSTMRYWLSEGIADYVRHQRINYSTYKIKVEKLPYKYEKEAYKEKILQALEIEEIGLSQFTSLPTIIQKDYAIFESLVYYLENKYGHEKFMEFSKQAFKTPNINEVLQSNFGINEEQLTEDWKKYFAL